MNRLHVGHPPPLERFRHSPTVALIAGVAALLVTYFILEWWLLRVSMLPEASYGRWSIGLEVLKSVLVPRRGLVTGVAQLGVLAALVAVGIRWRHVLWTPWSRLTGGRYLRPLVTMVAGILAWAFGTYDYNLYFDQAHLLDRLLLIGLATLIGWRPVFVLPFALMAISVVWQFTYPIGQYSVVEQFVLIRILILFAASFILRIVFDRSWSSHFIYLTIILFATAYLRCGIGKAELAWSTHGILNWATHGHIYLLTFATYANGWLGFLEPSEVTSLARRVATLDWLLIGGTIVLECGAFLVLWRRWSLLGFLVGWIGFHLGVFVLSGICFWKWMMVEGALLLIFLTRDSDTVFPLFTWRHFVLSLALMLGGLVWFNPPNLAWYDSATAYVYRFVGIGPSGARYSLPPRFFAPYDYQFTVGSFQYLSDAPNLGVAWGAIWSREAADALVEARSGDDVERIERTWGRVHLDEARSARLDRFLQRFVANLNQRGSKLTPLSAARAPRLAWTFPRPDAYRGQEPIHRVVITEVTTLFDGTTYQEFRERQLRSVEIPR